MKPQPKDNRQKEIEAWRKILETLEPFPPDSKIRIIKAAMILLDIDTIDAHQTKS